MRATIFLQSYQARSPVKVGGSLRPLPKRGDGLKVEKGYGIEIHDFALDGWGGGVGRGRCTCLVDSPRRLGTLDRRRPSQRHPAMPAPACKALCP